MTIKQILEEISKRISTMRSGGIEISPAMELIIKKEAELAYKEGYDCANEWNKRIPKK